MNTNIQSEVENLNNEILSYIDLDGITSQNKQKSSNIEKITYMTCGTCSGDCGGWHD